MIFAAKEAVERRARERRRQAGLPESCKGGFWGSYKTAFKEGFREGREEGRKKGIEEGRTKGRQEERERISKALAELGVALTPEQARIIAGESNGF